jgi:hypothetical protein
MVRPLATMKPSEFGIKSDWSLINFVRATRGGMDGMTSLCINPKMLLFDLIILDETISLIILSIYTLSFATNKQRR